MRPTPEQREAMQITERPTPGQADTVPPWLKPSKKCGCGKAAVQAERG
jgi:hypothetical protein